MCPVALLLTARLFDAGSSPEVVWSADGTELLVSVERSARNQIDRVSVADNTAETIVAEHSSTSIVVLPSGRLVFSQSSLSSPADLYTCSANGEGLAQLTDANAAAMDAVQMGEVSEIFCEGAFGEHLLPKLLIAPIFPDFSRPFPVFPSTSGRVLWIPGV